MTEENVDLKKESLEQSIKDLDPRQLRQLEQANKNLDRNPDYAIDVCRTILIKNPSCVEVRKILHDAMFRKAGKIGFGAKLTGKVQGAVFALKAAKLVKDGKAIEVLAEGENALVACPENALVLSTMASAAESLQFWGTAAECYRAISQFEPNNDANLIKLGNAYISNKQPEEALEIGDKILRRTPGNGEAQELARRASVLKTMSESWQEGASTRSTKGASDAAALERANALMNDEETLTKLVEVRANQIKNDPENINLYREICASLRSLKRYEDALKYVQQARQQPLGSADTTLEKLEQDIQMQIMVGKIEDVQKKLEADPSNEALSNELAALKKSEHEKRVEIAKVMVERYPNDYVNRYTYGKLMLDDGMLDEAIMQFQLSQRNPSVRPQSLLGLGRAFVRGGKFDLAVDQLETAKREAKLMNDAKKEIIYELACAYEQMGEKEKAFAEFKEIYSSDISFKDVAAKINAFYASKK